MNADDAMQGYELYSGTIADVLSEPSLHTPITVGLFARWGSGKSFLIGPLRRKLIGHYFLY
jgi:KAP family P-loop domain